MVDYWNSFSRDGRNNLFFDYEKKEKEINNSVIRSFCAFYGLPIPRSFDHISGERGYLKGGGF